MAFFFINIKIKILVMKNLFTLFELDNQKVENEWLEELIDNSTPDELMEWIELELWWVEYLSFSYRRKN